MTPWPVHAQRRQQRGNVFAMLFAAVALTGVLTAVGMQTLTGPVSTVTRVTQRNVADNNLLMNAKIIVNAAVTAVAGGDSDGDGTIEPAEFVPAAVGETPPTNGGFLPTNLGLALTDPWGTKYGYCVWDHGTTNASTNRLTGDNTSTASTQVVLALIAAGPDKTFQTTCSAYAGGPVQVTKSSGSDDLIFKYSYAEAAASSNGLWTINVSDDAKAELKDTSGSAVKVTIDRDTGIGDFLGLTTSVISAKTDQTIALDGGLLLDADGGGAATCTAAEKGSLRLNADRDDLELCDGAGGWVEVRTPPGGSAGHVQFNDGAGGFGGDANLFWDNTNKRLGIGTATPGYKLHVSGTGQMPTLRTDELEALQYGHIAFPLSTFRAGLRNDIGNLALSTVNASHDITFSPGSSEAMRIDGATGNVGIGTTSPTSPLHISNTAGGNMLRFDKSGSNPGKYVLGVAGNNGDFLIDDDTAAPARRLTIQVGTGYVGIGAASPAAPLHISAPSGNYGFSLTTPSTSNAFDIFSHASANYTYLRGSGQVIFYTPNGDTSFITGGSERFRMTLGGDSYFSNGNVGIGTGTPAAKLDVAGGVKIGTDAVCNSSKAGMAAWNANQLQVCDGTSFKNISAIDKLDDIGDVDVPTPNNNEILAWDSGTSRWVAKNVNTVGSAIATPGGTDKQVQFNDGGTLTGAAQLYWDKTSSRLGIGTATPGKLLHLSLAGQPAIAFSDTRVGAGAQTLGLVFDGGVALAKPGLVMQNLSDAGGFVSNSLTLFRDGSAHFGGITAPANPGDVLISGRVGIGTTTPQSLLQVAGGIQLGDDTSTCPGASNIKLGTLRFNGGNLQVCTASGWGAVSSGGGGSSEVSFTASGASNQLNNGTWVDLTGWTQLSEAGGDNFNASTGKFTAPSAGTYVFSATVFTQVGAAGASAVMIQTDAPSSSGTQICYSIRQNAAASNSASCTGAISLSAGQTVEAIAYQDNGTNPTALGLRTSFAGFMVGSGSDTLAGLSCASGEIPKWNGTAWACSADGGGSGGASSMLPGWPDAIVCSSGTSSRTLYYSFVNSSFVGYRHATGTASDRYVRFDPATGAYSDNVDMSGWDCVTNTWSIADLYAQGRAFNFVGGGGSGNNVPPTISFSGGGTLTVTLADNISLYQTDSHTAWSYYGTLRPYLVGTKGTDTVNGTPDGSAVTLTITGGSAVCYMLRNDAGWSPVSLAGWSVKETAPTDFASFSPGIDIIYERVFQPGSYSLDSLSAMYACSTVPVGGGSPGGSDKQIQFNDNGVFAGAGQLYWDKSNSRLGLGTATPESHLHVYGNSSADSWMAVGPGGSGTGSDGLNIGYAGASYGPGISFINAHSASGNTGALRIGTDAVVRMTIAANGNIGIGTAAPAALLHVSASTWPPVRVERSTAQTAARVSSALFISKSSGDMSDGFGTHIDLGIGDSGADSKVLGRVGVVRTGSDDTGALVFDTANAGSTGERMRIDASGKVGIGTTNPSVKLEVVGSGATFRIVDGVYVLEGGSYLGNGILSLRASDWSIPVQFRTDGAPSYFNVGKVGIGTMSPATKLHILSSLNDGIRVTDGTRQGFLGPSGWGGIALAVQSNHDFDIATNDVQRLKIAADGKVGIGIAAPAQRLDVSGDVRFNGVDELNWSGSIQGNQTVSVTFTHNNQASFEITAVMNHYGYITSYGCARKAIVANGSGAMDVINILNVSSTNGGSWTITRNSATSVTITKTAGAYVGGGDYFITVRGAQALFK